MCNFWEAYLKEGCVLFFTSSFFLSPGMQIWLLELSSFLRPWKWGPMEGCPEPGARGPWGPILGYEKSSALPALTWSTMPSFPASQLEDPEPTKVEQKGGESPRHNNGMERRKKSIRWQRKDSSWPDSLHRKCWRRPPTRTKQNKTKLRKLSSIVGYKLHQCYRNRLPFCTLTTNYPNEKGRRQPRGQWW